jgi:hypothetical protein
MIYVERARATPQRHGSLRVFAMIWIMNLVRKLDALSDLRFPRRGTERLPHDADGLAPGDTPKPGSHAGLKAGPAE